LDLPQPLTSPLAFSFNQLPRSPSGNRFPLQISVAYFRYFFAQFFQAFSKLGHPAPLFLAK
jgi:hypothetical protein